MKAKLPFNTDICQCPTCHLVFTCTAAFDKHRTGSHKKNERRCLTVTEMREKGMLPNSKGRWMTEAYNASKN